jgi:hypothetical protein
MTGVTLPEIEIRFQTADMRQPVDGDRKGAAGNPGR